MKRLSFILLVNFSLISLVAFSQIPLEKRTNGIYFRTGVSSSLNATQTNNKNNYETYITSSFGAFSIIRLKNEISKVVPIYCLRTELGISSKGGSFLKNSELIQINTRSIEGAVIVPLSFRSTESITTNIGLGVAGNFNISSKVYSDATPSPDISIDKFKAGIIGDFGFLIDQKLSHPTIFGLRAYTDISGSYQYKEVSVYIGLSVLSRR